jgi:hypothetical protein
MLLIPNIVVIGINEPTDNAVSPSLLKALWKYVAIEIPGMITAKIK